MREVIEIIDSSHWRAEMEKTKQLIHQREDLIAEQNPTMIISEIYFQAIHQLMQEEKIPV